MSNPNDYVITFLETKKELLDAEGCSACAAEALSKRLYKQYRTHVVRGQLAACQEVEEQGHNQNCKKKKKWF